MRQFLYRHLLLPAYETGLKRRRTFAYWRELERSQWFDAGRLREMQQDSLGKLLQHAYQHCPYYREDWTKRGLHPSDFRSLGDLSQWPIINRASARDQRLKMRANLPGLRLISKRTSGTTGSPVSIDLDTDSHDWRTAAWHRGYSWAGAEPGTRQLYVWALPPNVPGWRRGKLLLYHRLYRRFVVDVMRFDHKQIESLARRMNRYRADVIVGYTSVLCTIAEGLTKRSIAVPPVNAIVVGAEAVNPFQRQLLSRVFGAPVFETYGCCEFSVIGAECERHEGLHITSENLYVEIVDERGSPVADGMEGDVVVTDLHNYGMPFIRYATGDRAVARTSPCSCGRGLPMIGRIVGRKLDIVQTPDGRKIDGMFFIWQAGVLPGIRRFQVIQEQPDRVELRAILTSDWTPQSQQILETNIRQALGPGVTFAFKPVQSLPLTTAGKFRIVINSCPQINESVKDSAESISFNSREASSIELAQTAP